MSLILRFFLLTYLDINQGLLIFSFIFLFSFYVLLHSAFSFFFCNICKCFSIIFDISCCLILLYLDICYLNDISISLSFFLSSYFYLPSPMYLIPSSSHTLPAHLSYFYISRGKCPNILGKKCSIMTRQYKGGVSASHQLWEYTYNVGDWGGGASYRVFYSFWGN